MEISTRNRLVVVVVALAAVLEAVPFLSAQQSAYADLILRGGKVITVDARDRIAEASRKRSKVAGGAISSRAII